MKENSKVGKEEFPMNYILYMVFLFIYRKTIILMEVH